MGRESVGRIVRKEIGEASVSHGDSGTGDGITPRTTRSGNQSWLVTWRHFAQSAAACSASRSRFEPMVEFTRGAENMAATPERALAATALRETTPSQRSATPPSRKSGL